MGRALGFATVSVMKAVDEGARYGVEIVERSGRGAGTVYKTLSRLEERGFVEGRWEEAAVAEREKRPRRRYYRLTRSGVSALEVALARFGRLVGRVVADGGTAGE